MTNITHKVWMILARDPAVERNLSEKIINMRALAIHIIKKYSLDASVDSVISAIRRFDPKKISGDDGVLDRLFKDASITTKNNISCVVFRKKQNIVKFLSELNELVDFDKEETLRMIKGLDTLKILLDSGKLKKILPRDSDYHQVIEKLVEISIKMNPIVQATKGVIARLGNELAINDINIEEIIFSSPELLVYVKEENFPEAYDRLLKVCRGEV